MFRRLVLEAPNNEATFAEIGKLLASTLDIDQVYQQFAEIVGRIFRFDQLVITEIDANRNVRISHFSGVKTEHENYGAPIPLEGTLTDQVVQSRSPYLCQGRSREQIAEKHPWLLPTVEVGINSWLAVPLISQDEVIGAILVTSKVINAFTKQDTHLLSQVADQIVPAIANSRHYAESIKRNRESQALYRISRALAEGGSFQQKASRVAEELLGVSEADLVAFRIPHRTQETLELVASAGAIDPPPANIPFDTYAVGKAFESGETIIENDYSSHPDATPDYVFAGFKSALAMPVKFDEQVIGVIVYGSLNSDHFTEPRVTLLATVANVLGPLFQTAISAEELAVSDEIARIITSTLDIEEVYEQFAAAMKTLVDFDRVNINIIDHDSNTYKLAYLSTPDETNFSVGETFPLEGTATGFVFNSRSTLVMNDINEHPEFWTSQRNLLEGRRSVIVLPLFSKDSVIGTLAVFNSIRHGFGAREQVILDRLASQIAPAIENARLYEQVVSELEQRELAEGALQESESRFRQLFDDAPMGYSEIDIDGNVTRVNRTELEMLGYAAEEMVGHSFLEFISGQEQEAAQNNFNRVLARVEHGAQTIERTFQRKDGSAVAVLLEIRALLDETGRVVGFRRIMQDITERKQAEEALRESEEQHRTLLDLYPDGVVLEIDRKIVYANPALKEMTGYAEQEMLNVPPEEFIVPEDREGAFAVIHKLLAGTPGDTREYRVLKKDGTIIPTEISSRLITYLGKPAVLSVVRDITDRHRAEAARQESEELYRTLVDNSVLGLGLQTPGETMIFSNQRQTQITGYTKEEFESSEFNYLNWFFPEDQGMIAENTRRRLAGEPISPYEVRLITKDKTVKWVEVHNAFVRYCGRDAIQIQLLDITERKQVEERMRETSRLASIGELASGVAHEINNPLTSVLGFAQLLLAEESPKDLRGDLHMIYSEAQRAAKIVQSLQLFARKSEPKRELTDINLTLERALELKSADFNSSNIRISRDLSNEPLSSIADDHQLTQVFINILTNAQQAMQSSGRLGHISVSSSRSNGVIEVQITDNGPGIDPEVKGRIFEPFFTTKPVGVGTGLGLSICYGIMKDHGGDIWVENSGIEGTTFHIQIPNTDSHHIIRIW